MFICPTVDEAFHLLTEPSEPTTYFVAVAAVVGLSHNAKRNLHAWGINYFGTKQDNAGVKAPDVTGRKWNSQIESISGDYLKVET